MFSNKYLATFVTMRSFLLFILSITQVSGQDSERLFDSEDFTKENLFTNNKKDPLLIMKENCMLSIFKRTVPSVLLSLIAQPNYS